MATNPIYLSPIRTVDPRQSWGMTLTDWLEDLTGRSIACFDRTELAPLLHRERWPIFYRSTVRVVGEVTLAHVVLRPRRPPWPKPYEAQITYDPQGVIDEIRAGGPGYGLVRVAPHGFEVHPLPPRIH